MEKASEMPPDLDYLKGTIAERKAIVATERFKTAYKASRESAYRARDAMQARVVKVLSKRQRAKYESMLGKPFDLARQRDAEEAARKAGATPAR